MPSAPLQPFFRLSILSAAALSAQPSLLAAQRCEAGVRAARVVLIAGGFVAAQGVVLAARHDDWWTTPDTTFHFTSGGSASKGQDYLLHGLIAYHTSQLGALAFDWACVSRSTAGWLGAALGIAVGLPKEIGDGLHAQKGFATDDFGASVVGALLPALHRSVPASRAIAVKAFYWPSDEFRNKSGALPTLENDYAGQRYSLAIQPGAIPGGAGPWPDWLGLAVGHGVPHWATVPPVHDWYATLDIRLAGIRLGWSAWKTVSRLLDQVHIPLPGIRVRDGSVEFGVY